MNFKTATLEQMIQLVKCSNGFTITHARNYYQKKGREDVTTKIDLARELINLDKIQKTVKKLSNRLREIEAKRKIHTTNSQGYVQCKTRCLDASKIIADAVKNAL